ncbi:hypothetical protein DCCM_2896 [Desulfocucumis palustris]|uniref:Uncharacterized protein n=1 Tax=Desulfocucumis palustris TaxID=1898651 RepID=A0A2L2XC35_9FIRM|nr:hypothetical protein [Desulfocucumis palustris]GBF33785.1 hypothetical protein DCCM_2896 [Desulfocucumis palustris]
MAMEIEKLVKEIKALSPEQKFELARRLEEEAVFNDDQSWYWTAEWQEAEKEADEDFASNRVHHFENVDEAIKFLHQQADKVDGD